MHWALPGAALKEPGGHGAHHTPRPPGPPYSPAGQGEHAIDPEAAVTKPGSHARQLVAPVAGWYQPATQAAQLVDPSEGAADPASHGVHGSEPVGLHVPGAQEAADAGAAPGHVSSSAARPAAAASDRVTGFHGAVSRASCASRPPSVKTKVRQASFATSMP